MKTLAAVISAWVLLMGVIVAGIAGWITHVVHCIKTEDVLFLIAGAVAAPVGVVHGWGLWFGWWG